MLDSTTQKICVNDSRKFDYGDKEIHLVITSPPYPMVEMWDEVFSSMNKQIGEDIENGEGYKAFEKMHSELDKVWDNLIDNLVDGGIVCVNIGDATRRIGNEFKLYPNRDRIVEYFMNNGFNVLPGCVWRKISTGSSRFKGSGMLPTNAYFGHDHEHILVFRKNGCRKFEPKSENRYQSCYFWGERNKWFSDIWEVKGISQNEDDLNRDRLAAYPQEIPFRLINMFSVYKDLIVDPFCGTGTTNKVSSILGRNSIGVDLDENAPKIFEKRLENIKEESIETIKQRIKNNKEKMKEKGANYDSVHYDFKVKTKQESKIKFYKVDSFSKSSQKEFKVKYSSF